jgi:hypothetical protein
LNFAQAPTDSVGTGVGLHCSGIQGKLLIFRKNHFWICRVSFFHGTLTVKAGLHTAWPRAGSFWAPSFHAGPELGITNSKNQKNARPSCGVILCDLDAGKKIQT